MKTREDQRFRITREIQAAEIQLKAAREQCSVGGIAFWSSRLETCRMDLRMFDRSTEERTAGAPRTRWPLGICRGMDEHAERAGLGHWSATKDVSNEWWIRRDGRPHVCKWDKPGGYPDELRAIDLAEPPGPWVFGPNKPKKEKPNV